MMTNAHDDNLGLIRRVGGRLNKRPGPSGPRRSSHRFRETRIGVARVRNGASMFAIPFSVNMNESGQIGAGLALEIRYRTID